MCSKKTEINYENEIKKIPVYELKYYKCFGWKPVREQFAESSGWEYLSPGNSGFESLFTREYRDKIKEDESNSPDVTRLISIKRNSKFAANADIQRRYIVFFYNYYKRFNDKRRRLRQRTRRIAIDFILLVIFAALTLVSLSLSPVLNALINNAVPTSVGESALSFFHIAPSAIPDIVFTITGAIGAGFSLLFIILILSFIGLQKRIDKFRDKYIIPSLISAYITVRNFIKRDPSLMTERQRSNFIQAQIYRSALRAEDDDD